jgi:hypothetical protein
VHIDNLKARLGSTVIEGHVIIVVGESRLKVSKCFGVQRVGLDFDSKFADLQQGCAFAL